MLIFRKNGILEVKQDSYSGGLAWILQKLDEQKYITISRAFTFTKDDLLTDISAEDIFVDESTEISSIKFRFARLNGQYLQIAGRKLGIKNEVWIVNQGEALKRKMFVAEKNIRIFPHLASVINDDGPIIIGGDKEGNIPLEVYQELLKKFPNSTELKRYTRARIETIIGEFFHGLASAKDEYEKYLSKRKSVIGDQDLDQGLILQAEVDKFEYLRGVFSGWLENTKIYSEADWQKMIIKIILLMFPKYVAVIENVRVPDHYSSKSRETNRFIDLCLVDAGGTIDIIEIKQPFDNALTYRRPYRDNYIPSKELSGSIVQAEKYIFHLSKWGYLGEKKLTEKYQKRLPEGMSIRITNPRTMIIVGRDRQIFGESALTETHALDFEIIKRQYAHVMDILTYDDILRRLDNTISSLKKRMSD